MFKPISLIAKNVSFFKPTEDFVTSIFLQSQKYKHEEHAPKQSFKKIGDIMTDSEKELFKQNAAEGKNLRDTFSAY